MKILAHILKLCSAFMFLGVATFGSLQASTPPPSKPSQVGDEHANKLLDLYKQKRQEAPPQAFAPIARPSRYHSSVPHRKIQFHAATPAKAPQATSKSSTSGSSMGGSGY